MNGYYSRNYEYTARVSRPVASRTDRFLDMVYALLCTLSRVMRDSTARKIARYAVVVACAIGFIGLVGGMENGLTYIPPQELVNLSSENTVHYPGAPHEHGPLRLRFWQLLLLQNGWKPEAV